VPRFRWPMTGRNRRVVRQGAERSNERLYVDIAGDQGRGAMVKGGRPSQGVPMLLAGDRRLVLHVREETQGTVR
jgi:hypothetical protein